VVKKLWIFYAPGVGIGHFNRSMSLARIAALHGINVCILTDSPLIAELSLEIPANITVRMLWEMPKRQFYQYTALKIEESSADVVIIDAFPFGLGKELENIIPSVTGFKVFIHRLCTPSKLPRDTFEYLYNYDQIIVPGERAPMEHHPKAVKTDSWLSLPENEMLSREEAKRFLEAKREVVILVIGCGSFEEVEQMKIIAESLKLATEDRAHVIFASPSSSMNIDSIAIWPLLKLYNGIDLVVGQGGYNTVNECRATGTPLLAFERERGYDIQKERLHDHEIVKDNNDVLIKVKQFLDSGAQQLPSQFVNGAEEAFRLIQEAKSKLVTP
jgi:hypothetical protein